MMQLRTHRVGCTFDYQSMRYTGERIRKVARRELLPEDVFMCVRLAPTGTARATSMNGLPSKPKKRLPCVFRLRLITTAFVSRVLQKSTRGQCLLVDTFSMDLSLDR